jgi:HEAT repeat protein
VSGGGATAAAAAASLATLAPAGLACELTALLTRREPAIVTIVPSVLLAMAEGHEAEHNEVRACLATAIAQPGPARLDAIWTAATLADPTLVAALHEALGAPEAEVRQAAAWALGETPGDGALTAVLARVAQSDSDQVTRRLAAGAVAKRDGRAVRVWRRQ